MPETEILNARITYADVCLGGRGDDLVNLKVVVDFQGGLGGMVEGHHAVYLPPDYDHHNPMSLLAHIIHHWLVVTESSSVKKMVGKVIRLEMEKGSYSSIPLRVGHILSDDLWFSTEEICKTQREREQSG